MSTTLLTRFSEWMVSVGNQLSRPEEYLYEFIQFLNEYDYEIFRCSLGASSLHPEVEAQGYNYADRKYMQNPVVLTGDPFLLQQTNHSFEKGTVAHTRFRLGVRLADQFKNSPIPLLWSKGESIHIPIWNTDEDQYPVIKDLRNKGATDYFAVPIRSLEGISSYASFASVRKNGYSDSMLKDLSIMTELFAIGWYRFRMKDMLATLLSLYLGPMTAPKVLEGKIRRGDVEEMEAILWFSDIRGYSAISSQTDPKLLIEWLNDYYDSQIKNIHRFGGEVLKIMGDGMLAVFPTSEKQKIKTIARRSLLAAEKSIQILEESNKNRKHKGWIPLDHGVALHHGKVQYGNIGSGDRLDFTVIGNDVNLTARVSGLCSSMNEPILLSHSMDSLLPGRLVLAQSSVTLKGIASPQDIFKRKNQS